MRRWMRLSGMPSSTVSSASARRRQAVAEGVRRALEHQRQTGRALGHVLAAPALLARFGSGSSMRCTTSHGASGMAARQEGGIGVALAERLDADAVVGPRDQRVLEGASGQRLSRQAPAISRGSPLESRHRRAPWPSSFRILVCLSFQCAGNARVSDTKASFRTPQTLTAAPKLAAACSSDVQALPLWRCDGATIRFTQGARAFFHAHEQRRRSNGGRYEHLHRGQPQAGRQLSAAGTTASEIRQPARPRDRRDRHRQDRDAANSRRRLFQPGRAGLLRRREGRPFGHRDDGRGQGFPRRKGRGGQARSLRIPGISGDLLGSVRRAGPSDQGDRLGNGTAAAVAPDEPHRGAGRHHQHRLPHRRRGGPAASRHEGSAGAARQHRRAAPTRSAPLRQRHQTVGRRDPAHAAHSGAAGRAPISSASRR